MGTIKSEGKIYMQSVVDACCSLSFARRHFSTAPITAAETLHNRMFPFYDEHGVVVEHLLTENGREFRGKELQHPFVLYLVISQVHYCRAEVCSPESNGFCESFRRTVKEEFFSVAFRKTLCESVLQLQTDLDRYIEFYNRERADQGYRTRGRILYQDSDRMLIWMR